MKRLLLLTLLSVFLAAVAGCSLDSFFSPDYGNKEYPTTELPDLTKKPKQQEAAVEPNQRVTAPDEEAKLGPTPKSAAQTVRDETIDGRGAPVGSGTTASQLKVRTGSRTTFTGVVTAVDYVGKTISVKSAGKNLTFDLANPIVRGYKHTGEIQIGDVITVAYIKNGVGIVKGENFHQDLLDQTAPDELASSQKSKRSKKTAAKQSSNNHAAPVRVKYKVNTLFFSDVDNNKDGKISPVELGRVLPSLTMQDFKKYDRNGDGGLSESEYRDVRKR
jgi:CxxC motif-containing protein